jgi:hypothetical protein
LLAASGNDLYVGGRFTIAGGKVSGYLAKAVLYPAPQFASTSLEGSNLVLAGTGGIEGIPYFLLASTNVTAPMTNWVRVATNAFGPGGTFTVTNAVNPATPSEYWRLDVP